jgi:hypothetical protein
LRFGLQRGNTYIEEWDVLMRGMLQIQICSNGC